MLSVVVPCFNEEQRLPRTIEQIERYLDARNSPYELILVDDGSVDGTRRVMDAAAEKHHGVRIELLTDNRGKGRALAVGVAAAKGDEILVTDADLSTPIDELARLEAGVASGFDVAIGSRAVAGARIEVHQPFYREAMGRLFNRLVQALLLPGLEDTQCGFKLFTDQAATTAFSACRLDGFCFDVEALYVARRRGMRIAELPVVWRNDAATRVGLGGGAWAFADLLRIRLAAARGRYGPPLPASRPT